METDTMQAPMPQPTNVIIDVIRSPAVVIAAIALGVRWVIAPAITNYMRHELQAELAQLGQFPLFVERVKSVELAIEKLSAVPEALARIEEQVESLHDERRKRPQV
jgi:hypothetical protein